MASRTLSLRNHYDVLLELAFLRLLPNLGKVLSHSEYARLRLVCHTWNAIIASTRKFAEKQITLTGKNWTKNVAVQYNDLVTTWQTIAIKDASLITDKVFIGFWKIACKNIVELRLKNLQIQCSDLTQFLFHHCPHVESVTLDMIHYRNTKHETENGPILVLCDHQNLDEIGCAPTPNARTTITSIKMTSCLIAPNCVLGVLIAKSAGRLNKFTYEKAKILSPTRHLYVPTEAAVNSKLVNLVKASQKSLKHLAWRNNINGHEFFTQLSTLVEQRPVLTEAELQLHSILFEGYHRRDFAGMIPSDEAAFRFIKDQTPYLKTLSLYQGSPTLPMNTLPDLVPVLDGLEALAISLIDTGDRVVMNLSSINSLANLRFLMVRVHQRSGNPVVSPSYVSFIPNERLKSLFLVHDALTSNHFLQAIERLSPPQVQVSRLTNLEFTSPSGLCDRDLQILIRSVPQLKSLVVGSGSRITDSGITGLPWDTVLELRRNKTYHFLKNSVMVERESDGCNNLGQLQGLEVLWLNGAKISDVSVFAAFYFSNLRHLLITGSKVTDISLVHIAKHCSKLESLSLAGESRCTFHGLNAMLAVGKKITKIAVQTRTANRLLGRHVFSKYYVHPDFRKVVKTFFYLKPFFSLCKVYQSIFS